MSLSQSITPFKKCWGVIRMVLNPYFLSTHRNQPPISLCLGIPGIFNNRLTLWFCSLIYPLLNQLTNNDGG